MAKTQILEFTVYLTDQALVDNYNGQLAAGTGPGLLIRYYSPAARGLVYGIRRAPRTGAAVEFSAPFQDDNDPFTSPSTRSPWFTSGANFPTDVATFTRRSGGWFGISLFGQTTRFYWAGRFAFAPPPNDVVDPATGTPVPTPSTIPVRRWIQGFELPNAGEFGGLGGTAGSTGRDFDRGYEGLGSGYRASGVLEWIMPSTSAANVQTMWERFYLRPRTFPTAQAYIWWGRNFSQGGSGYRLAVTSTRQVAVYQSTGPALGDATLVGSFGALTLRQWYRIDLLTTYFPVDNPGTDGLVQLELYIDGVRQVQNSFAPGGVFSNVRHTQSHLGYPFTTGSGFGEFDFDNWRAAALPADKDPSLPEWNSATAYVTGNIVQTTTLFTTLPSNVAAYIALRNNTNAPPATSPLDWARLGASLDWLNGSRLVRVVPAADSPNRTGWTGAWQLALQRPIEGTSTATPRLTSTTALALLALNTDANMQIHQLPGAIGAVAAVIGLYNTRSSVDGQLGAVATFSDLTTRSVDLAIVQAVNPQWNSVFFNIADGREIPKVITQFELRHTKGNSTGNSNVWALQAVVEVIGVFGPEDGSQEGSTPSDSPAAPPERIGGRSVHNSQYIRTPWASALPPPFGAVALVGGTYAGTGAPLDLVFRLPVHWIWIRRTSGSADTGTRWWTSLITSHENLVQGLTPYLISGALRDPNFPPPVYEDDQEMRFLVRIISNDPQVNASGSTYQYIALCDPAARFLLCGALRHDNARTDFPVTDLLAEAEFTPEAGFFWPEDRSVTTTVRLAYKGPAHGQDNAALLAVAASLLTSYIRFGLGLLRSFANSNPVGNTSFQTAYALLRNNDGNSISPPVVFFQHASYTGNGVNPRTINVTPASGKRPLFAIVTGDGSTQRHYQRDPSHTGTNSTLLVTGTQDVSGITAGGIDQVQVGVNLNVSGVVYHVFVVPGSVTAGNNGWSINGEFFPAEPDSAEDLGWTEPVEVDPGPGGVPAVVPPIDFSVPQRLKLTYVDSLLYFDYQDTAGNRKTLLFEPGFKRWTPDVYVSGVTARLNEPGPQVHTNLIGCFNGQVYRFNDAALTDDGAAINWRVDTLWPHGDDPRAFKQWGDVVVDAIGGGGFTVTPVAANGATVLAATSVGSGAGRGTSIVEVNAGAGIIARNFGLRIAGALAAGAPARPTLFYWEPAFLLKQAGIARRATDWEDLGYPGAKFIQGVVIRANTFNVAKSVQVQRDTGISALTLSLQHNGEITRAYPLAAAGWTPFISELVRLQGADAVEWTLLGWRWIWEPAPEEATQWETQETTFDLPGFLHVRDAVIAYQAANVVTLTVFHEAAVQNHILPATGGLYSRYYQSMAAGKGKWARFRLTSSTPFRLFARDTSVRIQGWGVPGGYLVRAPFGGPSRATGAVI